MSARKLYRLGCFEIFMVLKEAIVELVDRYGNVLLVKSALFWSVKFAV